MTGTEVTVNNIDQLFCWLQMLLNIQLFIAALHNSFQCHSYDKTFWLQFLSGEIKVENNTTFITLCFKALKSWKLEY